jgi:two-component system chemotaxis sensor kinase CheA
VLSDLQRSVMKIRMVPVENLFRRFPRLVRDTARACDRNVELVLAGQETDLDKGILDALAEPVSHLVRNAISHGFESAEERRRAGKPEQGTLRLAAYHQGNQVVIELSDDGRGIDSSAIRNKAVAQGLVNSDEAQKMTETELLKLIFLPGFSTAQQVTEISGRGVGLDVVQNVLQRLKGSVGVESIPGHGTTFRLRLPLTLAIIKAILFRVEERLYAVPLNAVAEMTRIHQSEVHLVDGHEVVQLRKEVLTLVRLGRPAASGGGSKLFVLVVSHAGQKLGLVVDELAGQEELVIKALDTNLLSSELISGVSILGDGRVVLILNLAAVSERRGRVRNELGSAPWGLLLPAAEARQLQQLQNAGLTDGPHLDRPHTGATSAAAAVAGGEL